ncbi:Putative peptidase S8/S53 domain superfamily [Septoria linicola]|uniref:Peptidase S8/S53 domain superfamily n=1 Tax=Septoria linicola TaxID=215465 RepID=A0A9Q9AG67_9PEZI|nr:Putative peptidase S8/S53 domain superfamily [Septoria linicola]
MSPGRMKLLPILLTVLGHGEASIQDGGALAASIICDPICRNPSPSWLPVDHPSDGTSGAPKVASNPHSTQPVFSYDPTTTDPVFSYDPQTTDSLGPGQHSSQSTEIGLTTTTSVPHFSYDPQSSTTHPTGLSSRVSREPPVVVTTKPPSAISQSSNVPGTELRGPSSRSRDGFVFPITTSVDEPKPTAGGSIIPCKFWFFDWCLHSDDFEIGGWGIRLPPGVYVPGPPPSIKPPVPPPPGGLEINISGSLPKWPKFTFLTPTGGAKECEADIDDYIVYPRDPEDKALCDSISAALPSHVNNADSIEPHIVKDFGTMFWKVQLTDDQATQLRALREVVTVMRACKADCFDPSTELVYQDSSPDHLTFISWPPPQEAAARQFEDLNNQYIFDSASGKGVTVYILNTGATLDHEEFDLIRSRARWLHVGPDAGLPSDTSPQPEDDSQTDTSGRWTYKAHGTSMLGFVAGKNLGVVKNIDPVIVRLPRRSTQYGGILPEDWLAGLGKTYEDLGRAQTVSTSATSIILLAQYYPREQFSARDRIRTVIKGPDGKDIDESAGFEISAGKQLRKLTSRGASIVTGSGTLDNNQVDGWPANLGKPLQIEYIPSMIVAGSISTDGKRVKNSLDTAGPLLHVWAPGIDLLGANGNRIDWESEGLTKSIDVRETGRRKNSGPESLDLPPSDNRAARSTCRQPSSQIDVRETGRRKNSGPESLDLPPSDN